MALITKIKRQKVSQWIKAMTELAARAPSDDLKREAYRVANLASRKYGLSPEQKKADVLEHVLLGAANAAALKDELPYINHDDLYKYLRELTREGKIVEIPMQMNFNGPKVAHYFPPKSP